MYNFTNDSNTPLFTINAGTHIHLPPGFYTSTGIVTDINNNINTPNRFSATYLQNEGKIILAYNNPFTITTGPTADIIGLKPSNVYSSILATSANGYWSTTFAGQHVIKSSNICDFTTSTFVFLDIAELRSSSFIDTSSVNGSGGPVRRTFGPIPLNVTSGGIKTFSENTDYPIGVDFIPPLGSIERLTISWKDYQGNLINFNGFEDNAILLRFVCTI
jgi:hypothetical protein